MLKDSAQRKGLRSPPNANDMKDTVLAAIEHAKGVDTRVLDVTGLTDLTDYMVVVTGTSRRHNETIAERILQFMSQNQRKPPGIEGLDFKEWVLLDFIDVVVHIMTAKTRRHYDLEGLWDKSFADPKTQPAQPTV